MVYGHVFICIPYLFRIELYHLQDSTLAEKKKIRKALKDFESRFLLEHNRYVILGTVKTL